MDQKIVLKDGTEFLNGMASRSNGELMLTIPGEDFVGATLIFSDLEKIKEITCYFSVYKKVYFGFTQLTSVRRYADGGLLQIWLSGESDQITETSEYTVPEEYLPESMRTLNKKENIVNE